ncbi:Acyl-coa dehydrogenase/oxidase, partial [Globisporangium splendens]
MTEQVSASARRIEALTRHLSVTPLAVSTKAKVMAELAQERARASFPVRQMIHYVDGGVVKTKFREEMMQYLESYPELRTAPGDYDLPLAQRREQTLNKVRRLYQLFVENGTNIDKRNIMAELAGVYDLGVWVRNGVHFGLFVGAIMSQGDKEQQDEWMAPALMLEIFGSFAMTELGHGSHTRGFETTATFDHATDEFIIHTPTDTATKWWIGAAGETATHTVCFAQLIIDGESKGVQSFFVQLRDPQTHEPLPGVRIGDCGSKMGLHGVDNGWIQFNQVRVPRFNMLRRYAHVTREGEFVQTHKAQMAYAALIGTRGKIVTLSNGLFKKALTIAIRYCAVRRQGIQVNSKDPHEETKLIDYQSHQYRLMPLLAKAYAYHFQTSYIDALVEKFDKEGGDLSNDLLGDIHGTMAGLKAFSTWDTLAGIEECRQCCGGSGYSAYNGLSALLADFSVIVTFEGDNTVMAQQTASYLIRSVEALKNGQKPAGSVEYLEKVSSNRTQKRWNVHSTEDLANPQNLVDALELFAGKQVLVAAEKHAKASTAHPNSQEAWNNCQVDLIEIARVHVFYTVALRFIQHVQELKSSAAHSDLVAPLETLCLLYVLHEFDHSAAFFLKEGYMTSTQCELVHDHVLRCCARVRADAVPLVDTFNLSDSVLNSSIGHADGNVYEHILDVATKKTGISPYFPTAIKPMLEGEQLE